MQFFLYEIVARVVAIYLCVWGYRDIRKSLAERTFTYRYTDLVDILLSTPDFVATRDTTPIRYWIGIVLRTTSTAACAVIVIFGWFHPNA